MQAASRRPHYLRIILGYGLPHLSQNRTPCDAMITRACNSMTISILWYNSSSARFCYGGFSDDISTKNDLDHPRARQRFVLLLRLAYRLPIPRRRFIRNDDGISPRAIGNTNHARTDADSDTSPQFNTSSDRDARHSNTDPGANSRRTGVDVASITPRRFCRFRPIFVGSPKFRSRDARVVDATSPREKSAVRQDPRQSSTANGSRGNQVYRD